MDNQNPPLPLFQHLLSPTRILGFIEPVNTKKAWLSSIPLSLPWQLSHLLACGGGVVWVMINRLFLVNLVEFLVRVNHL